MIEFIAASVVSGLALFAFGIIIGIDLGVAKERQAWIYHAKNMGGRRIPEGQFIIKEDNERMG